MLLCVSFLQFDDSHELAIGLTEQLDENNRHLAGDEWSQFVDEYISEIPVGTVRLPYRRRNVRFAARALTRMLTTGLSVKEKAKMQPPSDATLMQQALKHTAQKSQLASKIDLRSFKLHFVEHTTDAFVRAAGKTNAKKIAAAKLKHKETQKKKVKTAHNTEAHRTARQCMCSSIPRCLPCLIPLSPVVFLFCLVF